MFLGSYVLAFIFLVTYLGAIIVLFIYVVLVSNAQELPLPEFKIHNFITIALCSVPFLQSFFIYTGQLFFTPEDPAVPDNLNAINFPAFSDISDFPTYEQSKPLIDQLILIDEKATDLTNDPMILRVVGSLNYEQWFFNVYMQQHKFAQPLNTIAAYIEFTKLMDQEFSRVFDDHFNRRMPLYKELGIDIYENPFYHHPYLNLRFIVDPQWTGMGYVEKYNPYEFYVSRIRALFYCAQWILIYIPHFCLIYPYRFIQVSYPIIIKYCNEELYFKEQFKEQTVPVKVNDFFSDKSDLMVHNWFNSKNHKVSLTDIANFLYDHIVLEILLLGLLLLVAMLGTIILTKAQRRAAKRQEIPAQVTRDYDINPKT